MLTVRRLVFASLGLATLVFLTWALPRALNPTPPSPEDRIRDREWIQSSPHWIDRQLCAWISVCGAWHIRWDPPSLTNGIPAPDNGFDELSRHELRSLPADTAAFVGRKERRGWEGAERKSRQERAFAATSHRDGASRPGRGKRRVLQDIPGYVLEHAPLVHLYSDEHFWPADIAQHVEHMDPYVNGSVFNSSNPLTLANMGRLNQQAVEAYLTSEVDVEERPDWLFSHVGIPLPYEGDGETEGPSTGTDEQPGGGSDGSLSEDSSWFDVDKRRRLHRISDPRKLPGQARGESSASGTRARRPIANRDMHRQRVALGGAPREQQPITAPLLNPDDAIQSGGGHKPNSSGYSEAPAVLIMVDKGSGILDAFWFFFYSFNLGQTVLDIRFGNHVADWEHCMVRFENGVPRAMALSQHEGGQAYAWSALEKFHPRGAPHDGAGRPIIYSAVGSHAMYATPGTHPYVLPFNLLKDVTDRGPLWDPAQNQYAYFYDYEADEDEEDSSSHDKNDSPGDSDREESKVLEPASSNPDAPTSWFHFGGAWGDETYSLGDPRQWRLFGQYHYLTGPAGPKFKHLSRPKVCQNDRCTILYDLETGKKATWYS